MSDEIKKITIFSTRFINGGGNQEGKGNEYLFSNTEKLFRKELKDYYVKPDDAIEQLLAEETSDGEENRLSLLLKRHLVTKALGAEVDEAEWNGLTKDSESMMQYVIDRDGKTGESLDELETESDKAEIMDNGEHFMSICLNIELETEDKVEKDNLKKRIKQWGLEDAVKDMVSEGDKRLYMYKLPGADVYAVFCPEKDAEKDSNGNRWIPCLLDCAHELTKVGDSYVPLDIRLVMHDKDLGEGSVYAGRFTALDEKDVNDSGLACGHLKEGDRCKIMFFQHTVGGIVDLLKPKGNLIKADDVHGIVDMEIDNYKTLAEYKDEGNEALNNANGLEACRVLNGKVIEHLKKL